jgi:uncharacterized protein (DUF1697 family)
MARFIALLRGINVGGRTIVPMAELRVLCAGIGWGDVATYIQSGNVVFEAAEAPAELETALEAALADRFAFAPPVMVRDAGAWARILAANPFPAEAEAEPSRVLVGLAKAKLADGAAAQLQERARAGERVAQAGGALWFHYPNGVGTSKLTPALIDKAAGSPVTGRNWRTMIKLQEMVAA